MVSKVKAENGEIVGMVAPKFTFVGKDKRCLLKKFYLQENSQWSPPD